MDSEPKPAEGTAPSGPEEQGQDKIQPIHVSKILDEVLEDPVGKPEVKASIRHPMILDVGLAVFLLVAMAGFTIGLIRIYITHAAEQSIMQRNYRAAIALLNGTPLPSFFGGPWSDGEELLERAYYLDAMSRLDANSDDPSALKELERIKPGSRFFELSQEILKEHFKPSSITLQGQAEHQATPQETQVEEKKPLILPEEEESK